MQYRQKRYFVNNLAKGWRGDSTGHSLAARGFRVKTSADTRMSAPIDYSRVQDEPTTVDSVDVGSAAPLQDSTFIPGYRLGAETAGPTQVATPGVPPPPTSIQDSTGGL